MKQNLKVVRTLSSLADPPQLAHRILAGVESLTIRFLSHGIQKQKTIVLASNGVSNKALVQARGHRDISHVSNQPAAACNFDEPWKFLTLINGFAHVSAQWRISGEGSFFLSIYTAMAAEKKKCLDSLRAERLLSYSSIPGESEVALLPRGAIYDGHIVNRLRLEKPPQEDSSIAHTSKKLLFVELYTDSAFICSAQVCMGPPFHPGDAKKNYTKVMVLQDFLSIHNAR
ncbi:hypothetical protein AXG93_2189s1390 [Marchantia polymorpha subsp. ruderalis]|uniref:Uncharacterized protein n=1 Tax=Marchantia polymorpha subsp. ruderalis TaxID=1480154 RepID=A0A176WSL1_MARPO|nr:hypothetical protein AXG93_2189s1390 [Marchantia polymorpha subsp. ruderalis]